MLVEGAIELLKEIRQDYADIKKYYQALDMAIEKLEEIEDEQYIIEEAE